MIYNFLDKLIIYMLGIIFVFAPLFLYFIYFKVFTYQENLDKTITKFETRQTLMVKTLIQESETNQIDRADNQSLFMMEKFSQMLDQKFSQFTMHPAEQHPHAAAVPTPQYNPWSKRILVTPTSEQDTGELRFRDENMEIEANLEGKSRE